MLKSGRNKDELSDGELIHRYRNSHDIAYAGRLYTRYSYLVFGVCIKYFKDADQANDAVMAIFEELISLLKRHEIQNFPAWLHMVSKNHCLMKLRKRGTENRRQQEYYNHVTNDVESDDWLHLEGKQDKEILLRKLEDVIPLLKNEQKTCIDLFYLQQKSYKEVSDLTGYSLNEVKSYIQNGKRNLKILLEQTNG